jgi:formylglycine-generating enzyme required for sulfatase activity
MIHMIRFRIPKILSSNFYNAIFFKRLNHKKRASLTNTRSFFSASVFGLVLFAETCLAAGLPNATFPLAPPPPGPPIAIVGASVVDVIDGKVIPNAVVLVQGNRIAAIGPANTVSIPGDARILRLDGQYLIPGLINSHVHLASALPGVVAASETDADIVLRMTSAARKSLESGVTTVRIVGAQNGTDFSLKRAINAGAVLGPRIETAGEVIVPTGGHGNRPADGPDEFTKATRDQIQRGASWIKISISGGIADTIGSIDSSPMTADELKAVIEAAHRNNIRVTAHNGSPVAGDDALAQGIDGFEHGYFLKTAQLKKMKEKGVWLVPTILVSQPAGFDFYKRKNMPTWYLDKVTSVGQEHWAMLVEAIKLGVPIALGTDQDPFESNEGTTATIREAELYVAAGMTPLSALRTATSAAAEMLRMSEDIGSLRVGRFADIVALKENPLKNISALRTLNFVMKGGEVIVHSTNMAQTKGSTTATNSLGMSFVTIPAGEFNMGSDEPLSDALKFYSYTEPKWLTREHPQHKVRITKPFEMGQHEVTLGQFQAFVAETKYILEIERNGKPAWGFDTTGKLVQANTFRPESPGWEINKDHPVVFVSWNDAMAFCEWLSKKEGGTYRLPTEAEWEYAARAGSNSRYHFGNDPEDLVLFGNVADQDRRDGKDETIQGYDKDGNKTNSTMPYPFLSRSDGFKWTSPVGKFKPNAFGLYDMHGNVWEWTADRYAERYYDDSPEDNPLGPTTGNYRVIRGGGFNNTPVAQRSAYRIEAEQSGTQYGVGFRVVRES